MRECVFNDPMTRCVAAGGVVPTCSPACDPDLQPETKAPFETDPGVLWEIDESTLTRHPSSERFHELLKEMGDLHDKKQADYGQDDDPFANVRASESFGIAGWVGCMVRAADKVKRLQTLAIKGELANEAAVDAFMDLAVYAVIGRILFEETI